jgi:DNA modification methylase
LLSYVDSPFCVNCFQQEFEFLLAKNENFMDTNHPTPPPLTWTTTKRKVSELLPAGYNPRKMSESERRNLKDSITEFGTVVPVVLNIGTRENVLIGGHQRVSIYADLGIDEIDAMIPNRELDKLEEQTLNLRLNKNLGSWDESLLKEIDMNLLLEVGFDDEDLQALFDDIDVIEDDFDLEKALKETKVARVKPGEIWQLGEHRLLVGDSTNPEQVKKLMAGDFADVIYCDPPYNIGMDYSKGIGTTGKYEGSYTSQKDSKKDSVYMSFIDASIAVALLIAKPNAHLFYWTDSKYIWLTQTLYQQHKIDSKRVCLWIKNNFNMTPKVAWNKVYEPCIYGTVGKPHLNRNFNNANEILNQEIGSGNQVHEEILEMIDLWIEKRDAGQSYFHPTQKPVTLNEKPLKRCSAPGQIVFSGFAGSGSDLIACEQLGRKWRGVEIDPIFATVCLDRWEAFTNQKAILL